MKNICLSLLLAAFAATNAACQGPATYSNRGGLLQAADPFVLHHDDQYYLYATSARDGINVWQSTDLVNWQGPVGATDGRALHARNSWGDKNFWAPEVIRHNDTFYMFYTVDEHLAVATAKHPAGPFLQPVKQPLHPDIREIDSHVFIDDDGQKYIYFVRFDRGNHVYGARLADDLLSVEDSTTRFLLRSQEGTWEDLDDYEDSTICEGPFILKHKGLYYLTYSANHYRSKHYAVGYATSRHPLGPFTRSPNNPILQATDEVHGPGHHSFIKTPAGELFIVYHTHNTTTDINPRKIAIDRAHFLPGLNNQPDQLVIKGPTLEPQPMPR